VTAIRCNMCKKLLSMIIIVFWYTGVAINISIVKIVTFQVKNDFLSFKFSMLRPKWRSANNNGNLCMNMSKNLQSCLCVWILYYSGSQENCINLSFNSISILHGLVDIRTRNVENLCYTPIIKTKVMFKNSSCAVYLYGNMGSISSTFYAQLLRR
jgi:hypothetical protein